MVLVEASVVVAALVRVSVIDGKADDACRSCLVESLAPSAPEPCSESRELQEPARDKNDLENDPDVNGEEDEKDEEVEKEEEEEKEGLNGGLDLWVDDSGSS